VLNDLNVDYSIGQTAVVAHDLSNYFGIFKPSNLSNLYMPISGISYGLYIWYSGIL